MVSYIRLNIFENLKMKWNHLLKLLRVKAQYCDAKLSYSWCFVWQAWPFFEVLQETLCWLTRCPSNFHVSLLYLHTFTCLKSWVSSLIFKSFYSCLRCPRTLFFSYAAFTRFDVFSLVCLQVFSLCDRTSWVAYFPKLSD